MEYIYNYDNLFCLVQFKSLQTNWADEIFTFKTCASTQSNENSLTRPLHTSAKHFPNMHAYVQPIVHALISTKYITDLVWRSLFARTASKTVQSQIWPNICAPSVTLIFAILAHPGVEKNSCYPNFNFARGLSGWFLNSRLEKKKTSTGKVLRGWAFPFLGRACPRH